MWVPFSGIWTFSKFWICSWVLFWKRSLFNNQCRIYHLCYSLWLKKVNYLWGQMTKLLNILWTFFQYYRYNCKSFVSHQSVVQQYVNFKIVFSLQFQGRNRQSGEQNNSSDKDNKSEGAIHNNNRHHGESGRGRGSREDRWNDRKPGGRGL